MTDHDQLISRLLSLSHHAKKLTNGILYNDHPHSLDRLYRDTIERAGDESEAAARCIKQLLKQVEDLKKGFEGCCYACEPVGLLNKQLLGERDDARWWAKETIDALIKERDEARREICVLQVLYSNFYRVGEEKDCAIDREWDCYEETP